MTYNDPQDVHGGECDHCGRTVRDNEQDLFAHGRLYVCEDCADEFGEEPEDDEPLSLAKPVKTDWLFIAGDLTGAL
jgi:ribosome-binding protein aMBF1 (putative translation factor)